MPLPPPTYQQPISHSTLLHRLQLSQAQLEQVTAQSQLSHRQLTELHNNHNQLQHRYESLKTTFKLFMDRMEEQLNGNRTLLAKEKEERALMEQENQKLRDQVEKMGTLTQQMGKQITRKNELIRQLMQNAHLSAKGSYTSNSTHDISAQQTPVRQFHTSRNEE